MPTIIINVNACIEVSSLGTKYCGLNCQYLDNNYCNLFAKALTGKDDILRCPQCWQSEVYNSKYGIYQ